jgi:hypothetical protein
MITLKNGLEILVRSVLEVEFKELEDEFDMYDLRRPPSTDDHINGTAQDGLRL